MRQSVIEGANPRDIKFQLGQEIVARFHDTAAAEAAQANFIARFQQGAMPEDMPEVTLDSENGEIGIASLIKGASLTGSTSDAFRMIKQGAVRIDGQRVEDRNLTIKSGSTHVFQVGKRRFARITVT